jgi:quercetin dioxygenase-like cupin family protein
VAGALLVAVAAGFAVARDTNLWGAGAAEAETAPRVLNENSFAMPATLPPPPAGVNGFYHYVVEFAPGAQTPTHSHPGGCVATVIEGQVTNRFPNSGTVAGPGKTLVTPGGQLGRHTNDSSTIKALYFASCYAADGVFANIDMTAPGPPIPPNVLFASGMGLTGVPSQFTVVQRVIEFAPGASGDLRSAGAGMLTVLSGQLQVKDKRLAVGDSAVSQANESTPASNPGTSTTRVVATYLVPAGAVPSTPSSPVRPPSTGDGGLVATLSFSSSRGFGSMPGMWFCWMGATS